MPVLVPIVEGFGEIEAVPLLLRKALVAKKCWTFQIALPKNAHGCGNLTKEGGLEKFIELAFRTPDCAAVLILMDSDENCPKELAEGFAARIRAVGARRPVAIVLARQEYEAWFIASLESIAGHNVNGQPAFAADIDRPENCEDIGNVKGWITRHFPNGRAYKETEDQAPMTNLIDLSLARQRSRSFRRLCHAVDELVLAVGAGSIGVTP